MKRVRLYRSMVYHLFTGVHCTTLPTVPLPPPDTTDHIICRQSRRWGKREHRWRRQQRELKDEDVTEVEEEEEEELVEVEVVAEARARAEGPEEAGDHRYFQN
jgi:hypothetical protein